MYVVVVSFSQRSYEVLENNGSVMMMISLSKMSLVQFEVEISALSKTATGNVVIL